MKRIVALLLTVLIAAILVGCKSDQQMDDSLLDDDSAIVLDTEEQRALYYDAVEKTLSLNYLRYNCLVTNVLTFSSNQTTSEVSAQIKVIDSGTDDARYYASIDDGDMELELYYLDGCGYSGNNECRYKSAMTEASFVELMDSYFFLAVGEEFESVEATPDSDTSYFVSLSGAYAVPEILQSILNKKGMTDISLTSIEGSAVVDSKGYLTEHNVVIKLAMKCAGETVTVEYMADVSFDNPGQKFTMTLPDDDECTQLEDITAPFIIEKAYEKLLDCQYNASYNSAYSYSDNNSGKKYSMDLDYSQETFELDGGFEAEDNTVIHFNSISSKKTVKRSSSYADGVYKSSTASDQEMPEASARTMYYNMLLDYQPEPTSLSAASIADDGDYIEISYKYFDTAALFLCQSVLTTLIEDQLGTAIYAEEYTIEDASGTIRLNKTNDTLISHEIGINVHFEGNGRDFTVSFEYFLEIE